MKIKDVAETLERFAPLPLQESYDNAGLQIGLTAVDNLTGVLLCLDVTEDVLLEAHERGLNLVVSHHPLLFRGLKRIADEDEVQRCVRLALRLGVGIYSAHTNLDNAAGGVNWALAELLGGENIRALQPQASAAKPESGSGAVFDLQQPMTVREFIETLRTALRAERVMTNWNEKFRRLTPDYLVRRVAVCGGAGDFLLPDALRAGADAFLTGEMHYHQYFGYEGKLLLCVAGHYETEHHAIGLLHNILAAAHPTLRIEASQTNTNPIVNY